MADRTFEDFGSKTSPDNTDIFPFKPIGALSKKITWAQIKTALTATFASVIHTHAGTDITTGTISTARLNTSAGGGFTTDSGKLPVFGAFGSLTASGYVISSTSSVRTGALTWDYMSGDNGTKFFFLNFVHNDQDVYIPSTSGIMLVDAENLADVEDPDLAKANLGITSDKFAWRFSSSQSISDPGSGYFNFDDTIALAGSVVFSQYAYGGILASSFFDDILKVGDMIYIEDISDSANSMILIVDSAPVDLGTYYQVSITVQEPPNDDPDNGRLCSFRMFSSRIITNTIDPLTPAEIGMPQGSVPYLDLDAAAAVTAAGVTDSRAIMHYHRIARAFKALRVWGSLENAYLIGTNWQSSSGTLKSLTGTSNATGSSTFADYGATFNGTTHGYTFSNVNAGTGITGKTFVCLYTHNGVKQPDTLISNYEGGVIKGMHLGAAGSEIGITGGSLMDNAFVFASADGSAATLNLTANTMTDTGVCFAAASHLDGYIYLYGNREQPVRSALASQWINNATFGIGKTANGAYFHAGQIIFAAVFEVGLEDWQIRGIQEALESILSDVITLEPGVVFEGNSLTSSAAGGGTAWPTQLLAMAGWSSLKRKHNVAADGSRQTQGVEQQYWSEVQRYKQSAPTQDHLLILWSGINDITAGIGSAAIIASLERMLKRARADGMRTVILTLTPVADTADGLTYGYSSGQQAILTTVNNWILGVGSEYASQVVDLNEIALAYPDFGDPTDSTYYVAGDGLHHNDAGRALIAAKVFAEVTVPA